MSWIIALIIGAIVGWLANRIMKTGEEHGLLMDIIIGIIGAFLGRWLFADLLNIGTAASAGTFSFWGILWALLGAVILIGILRALHVYR